MNLPTQAQTGGNRQFATDLARAFGGALLFSFPILMTMEMWGLGFAMSRLRLFLFIVLAIPLLVGLSYYGGFEETSHFLDDVVDAFAAFAVGFIASALILYLFALIKGEGMATNEIIGKISLQAVTGAMGALLAQDQLHGKDNGARKRRSAGYWGQLFLMIVGALFLSMSISATEEVVLIAYRMGEWRAITLALMTILMMHAFVYHLNFRGQEEDQPKISLLGSTFVRFTLVGYALALLISLYLLWSFGRTDGLGLVVLLKALIVLAFPAALGAAAFRLIL